jgi:hypothetical protein
MVALRLKGEAVASFKKKKDEAIVQDAKYNNSNSNRWFRGRSS